MKAWRVVSDQNPDLEKTNPKNVLQQIRDRLAVVAREYSSGKLNAVQFNALYRHYMEKRLLIEKLLERNPDTDAWRAAASEGTTTYLRERYEARALYWVVFQRGSREPLTSNGKLPAKAAQQVIKTMHIVWKMPSWKQGLARKSLGDGMWLLLNMGQESLTLAVYFFQPSSLQTNQLRDLHTDFERANARLLTREGVRASQLVFPQRSLIEQGK